MGCGCHEASYRILAQTLKVLLISTSVVPIGHGKYGGIEKLCGDFIEGLKDAGQDVTVAAPIGSGVPDGVELIETVRLPEEQDRDATAWTRLTMNADVASFDVIHDFSHQHYAGRLYGTATISMLWNPIVHKYPVSPFNIVCLSDWQRQRFEKLYNQKAIVMPMLVDTKKYKPVPHPRRERFLFLGKISPEKGVHLALRYCRELGVELDVVGGLIPSELGSSYLQSIRSLCDGEHIKLHFNVTEEEKIDFLQNAKAVIYPVQQEEAHWLVGIEAGACGTLTITYAMGAFPEVCYGFVADSEAVFKDMMGNMSWMSGLMPDAWAQGNYSRDVVIPKYLQLYKEVGEGRRW